MEMNYVKSLKVTTLIENISYGKCLAQWGLSLLIEAVDAKNKKTKIVFDTGVDKKAMLYNIKTLKQDVTDVEAIVISHGHHDHTAAIVEITKAAGNPKIYAHPHVFLKKFYIEKNGKRRSIGVPKKEGIDDIEKAGGEIQLKATPTEVAPGIWTTGQIPRTTNFEQPLPLQKGERLIKVIDEEETDDQILDDQALWMNVKETGPTVITGCAHAGPINTLLHVQKIGNFKRMHTMIGGTHLVDRTDHYFQQTVNELRKIRLKRISPCHCTGFKATSSLWNAFPKEFILNYSGRIIETAKKPEMQLF
jgi:7,8-dihydropterin-6-yl-methyl-4-(beta-D-ribofuranosyl)aminobenzene 5'-phosphate synthase